jgi:hypothetical protein
VRTSILAIVLGLLASFGAYSPVAAAQTSTAKVVIIVGATHGVTPTYRAYANQIYDEAIRYTPNVVKVYSPNATWSKVKAAASGANVLIYLGHGNGWPSPYTYDPEYTTKDGFGLNATAGNGDYNNKYYGEPYVRTLNLAPNALVLLFHLCYASGNSEPGDPAPKLSTAKARADNYATAFLKAGASAVIADGHVHSGYLTALFTSSDSLSRLWSRMTSYNHEIAFDPTRSTGNAVLDPDKGPSSPSGFYRSIVGNLDTSASAVLGQIPTGSVVVPLVRSATTVSPVRTLLGGLREVSTR